jgi:hypothetical protein
MSDRLPVSRLGGRIGRIVRRRRAYACAAAAAVLAAGAVTAVGVNAASAQSAPTACAPGYLCLALSPAGTGNVALVAAGHWQDFALPTGLPVTELVNNTTTLYCIEYKLSSGVLMNSTIAAGSTQATSYKMLSVSPGPICPA